MTTSVLRVLVAVALAGVAWACESPESEGGPLVYCSEDDPQGFDPAMHTTGTTFDASSRQVYDRLYRFDSDGELEPALAESVETSDDGLVYTFHLRRGVTFHSRPPFEPTRDFNAEDVVWSLDRQRGDDAGYEYFDAMNLGELLDEVVVLDDHTVRMTLSEPNTTLPAILAMDFTSIISAEYYEHLRARDALAELDSNPVGTGPYQFEGYVPGVQIRYRAHPGYWRGPAPAERLVFAITPSAVARYRGLRVGDCDIMSLPAPADVEAMRNHPEIAEVLEKPGLNVAYLAWNTQRPPFDNPDVRRATAMAIDIGGLLEAVYRGAAIAAKSPIPIGMRFHAEDLEGHEYDPQAARRLLAAAGISGRLRTTIWAPAGIERAYMPNFPLAAELIQRDLAVVGIDADVRLVWPLDFPRIAGDDQRDGALLLGWSADQGDADEFVGTLLTCGAVGGLNAAQWCNAEFDAIVRRARTISDPAERAALYRRAQEIFIDQAPWVPLAHAALLDPVRREVCGYEVDPFGLHSFYGARFCEAE